MRSSLLSLCLLPLVFGSSCPSGLELVRDGQCRGVYDMVNASTNELIDSAIASCNEIKAQPVIIHTAEQRSYWTDRVMGVPNDNFVIELDGECEPGCSWTREAFADDGGDGVCYQFGATAANWQDAQALCKQFGAELASVHNQQEKALLRRLAVSRGAVNGLFLGATIAGKGKDFGSADGTEWDYAYFYSGFPIPGYGDCLAMDTSSASGQWMNIDCSAQLPVACVRKRSSIPLSLDLAYHILTQRCFLFRA